MRIFLRWLAVLPGAILATVLVSFPLHFVLYQTLTNFVEPYPEFPERILYPFAAAIAFQWAGVKIAPSHKNKMVILLFSLLLVASIASVWLRLSGVRLMGDFKLVARSGGIEPIFSIMGIFAGLYINWKTQWETENEFDKIRFRCRNCEAKYSASTEQIGTEGKCKKCGESLIVPDMGDFDLEEDPDVDNLQRTQSNQIGKVITFKEETGGVSKSI